MRTGRDVVGGSFNPVIFGYNSSIRSLNFEYKKQIEIGSISKEMQERFC